MITRQAKEKVWANSVRSREKDCELVRRDYYVGCKSWGNILVFHVLCFFFHFFYFDALRVLH